MKIASIHIANFRKLLQCRIDLSKETTLFVGANNSGKTSAMDALGKFLAGRNFVFNDITVSNRTIINSIGSKWQDNECEIPEDLIDWDPIIPKMDIWLEVLNSELHYVAGIIPTLKWRGGRLGLRLAYLPKNITKLFAEYREAYFAARTTEEAKPKSGATINLFPQNLCDFLEKRLSSYFSIRAFILDPAQAEADPPQTTLFEMECFTDNPLKGIIKVDMIDAQQGFTDPNSSDGGETSRNQLSDQLRKYYDKHLDPEKIPSPADLEILEATETARKVFDETLATKFQPAIHELEGLGCPGVIDPKLTITTKFTANETLKHDSAVQYALSKNDTTLRLPEKYNGLGYQNLISMVFDLMRFRDDWMREGKAKQRQEEANLVVEPLHLVLVEEPEAHLHMQVQQVFIRKAYKVLQNHKFLKDNPSFTTQLLISTHSSHIARETSFADLRYFKRLSEGVESEVATSKVINLSDVFGKGNETEKFITRYLQATHCDLFFADAAILVEGAAESMLFPHFIRNKYPELFQRYISILSINGRHTSLRDGSIFELSFLAKIISPLVKAYRCGNDFEVSKIIRQHSPLVAKKMFATKQGDQTLLLKKAEYAVETLMELWKKDINPSCIAVLKSIHGTGLFDLGSRIDEILSARIEGEDTKITALREALKVPFDELERYFAYVTDKTRFATHQGVKGLEFPRVMVIMDDTEARGFLFSYEKLFGAKAKTETDKKNEQDGKDTRIMRTTRLFYVACTRAEKSLAVVAYTEDVQAVKNTAIANKWFAENEILLI